jgi:putative spermidine/putrescine transport system permease protein
VRLRAFATSWSLLVLPLLLVLIVLFAYPALDILRSSFTNFRAPQTGGLDNYDWFFGTPSNMTILRRTFATAAIATAACLLVGYPYAYLMTIARPNVRFLMLAALMLAFWTSFMVRNFSWVVLLQDNGPVNDVLEAIGIGRQQLVGSVTGVTIGLTQMLLPIMVLPLYATMRTIDRRLLLAAEGLGAKPRRAFIRVYLPLSIPGVLAGSLLVFVITLGFYITPALLGSPKNAMLSQTIVQQATQLLAFGRAGAAALILVLITFVLLGVIFRMARRVADTPAAGGDR